MGAEEVGIEDGCEEELADDDFCGDGEDTGGIVEVSREEEEPGQSVFMSYL